VLAVVAVAQARADAFRSTGEQRLVSDRAAPGVLSTATTVNNHRPEHSLVLVVRATTR
jgi:hypothetical protein